MLTLNGQVARHSTNPGTGATAAPLAPVTSGAYWALFLSALIRALSVSPA
jgi:hypothetical protein